MIDGVSGAEFKQQLRSGIPKFGLFLNSHSPTVAEQLAHSGYDWLLVDTQHGLPLRQRRQRSASHPHAGRRLREGHRRRVEGKREGLVAAPFESAVNQMTVVTLATETRRHGAFKDVFFVSPCLRG